MLVLLLQSSFLFPLVCWREEASRGLRVGQSTLDRRRHAILLLSCLLRRRFEAIFQKYGDVVGLHQLDGAIQIVSKAFDCVPFSCFFSEGEVKVNDVHAQGNVAKSNCK